MNIGEVIGQPFQQMPLEGSSTLTTAIAILLFVIALNVVSIIGSSISLFNSLREQQKRTAFIVFSSLGLAGGIMGFFNSLLTIPAIIFTIVSMSLDEKHRKLWLYILTIAVITAGGTAGYNYMMNSMLDAARTQLESGFSNGQDGKSIEEDIQNVGEDIKNLQNVGSDTLRQLGE